MPASGQRNFSLLFLYQDLDTPFSGGDELPNPDGRRTLQRSLLLRGEVGLGERYAVRALLPLRTIDAAGDFEFEGEGLGDLEVELMRRLGPEGGRSGGALGAGLALPTAESAPVGLVGENVFFGAGAVSMLVTLEGYRRLAPTLTLFGSARYRLPLDEGDEAYRFGDDLGYQATLAWSRVEGRLGVNAGLSSQHLGRDEQAGAELDSRGGRLAYASLGIRYRLRDGLDLGLASSWLVDQDVRGDQLLARRQATFGLAWSWGAHEHEGEDEDDQVPSPANLLRGIAPPASSEPSLEEQSLEELLELFPRGVYRFRGTTTEGKPLRGSATLTHRLPDGPVLVSLVDGDEVDPDDAVFTWLPVDDPPGGQIVGYEIVIGCEEPDFLSYTAQAGPEVLDQEGGDECKWEAVAREGSDSLPGEPALELWGFLAYSRMAEVD